HEDVAGVAGVGEAVEPSAAVDLAVQPPAGLEGEGVAGRSAGDALEVAEGEPQDFDGIDAGDGPRRVGVGPDDGVRAASADEPVDVGEGAADAGGGVGAQADGHRRGEVVVVQGVAAAAAVDVPAHTAAGEEYELVIAAAAGEVFKGREARPADVAGV